MASQRPVRQRDRFPGTFGMSHGHTERDSAEEMADAASLTDLQQGLPTNTRQRGRSDHDYSLSSSSGEEAWSSAEEGVAFGWAGSPPPQPRAPARTPPALSRRLADADTHAAALAHDSDSEQDSDSEPPELTSPPPPIDWNWRPYPDSDHYSDSEQDDEMPPELIPAARAYDSSEWRIEELQSARD